jgi:hypothetical protein
MKIERWTKHVVLVSVIGSSPHLTAVLDDYLVSRSSRFSTTLHKCLGDSCSIHQLQLAAQLLSGERP